MPVIKVRISPKKYNKLYEIVKGKDLVIGDDDIELLVYNVISQYISGMWKYRKV